MRSAGWCTYMQSQLEREERQKEYERKRSEQRLGKRHIHHWKAALYVEVQCISVKENTVIFLDAVTIQIVREQEKYK